MHTKQSLRKMRHMQIMPKGEEAEITAGIRIIRKSTRGRGTPSNAAWTWPPSKVNPPPCHSTQTCTTYTLNPFPHPPCPYLSSCYSNKEQARCRTKLNNSLRSLVHVSHQLTIPFEVIWVLRKQLRTQSINLLIGYKLHPGLKIDGQLC